MFQIFAFDWSTHILYWSFDVFTMKNDEFHIWICVILIWIIAFVYVNSILRIYIYIYRFEGALLTAASLNVGHVAKIWFQIKHNIVFCEAYYFFRIMYDHTVPILDRQRTHFYTRIRKFSTKIVRKKEHDQPNFHKIEKSVYFFDFLVQSYRFTAVQAETRIMWTKYSKHEMWNPISTS